MVMTDIIKDVYFSGFTDDLAVTPGSKVNDLQSVINDFQTQTKKYPEEIEELKHFFKMATPNPMEVPPSVLLNPIVTGASGLVAVPTNTIMQSTAHRRGTKFPPPNIHDQRYLKPFEFGWTRELVYRATHDPYGTTRKRKGDIYYYSPSGKKARSYREIQSMLHDGLTVDNFTFLKEVIGVDNEIVREANSRSRGSRSANQVIPKSKVRSRQVSDSSDSMLQNSWMSVESSYTNNVSINMQTTPKFEKYVPNRSLLQDSAYAYSTLFEVFRLLRVQDILSCAQVCKMWNHVAHNSSMWNHVVMKNSSLVNWEGMLNTLNQHQTKSLDLRKVLLSKTCQDSAAYWSSCLRQFYQSNHLVELKMCRCPGLVIEELPTLLPNLETLQACQIDGRKLSFDNFSQFQCLKELKLKSTNEVIEVANLEPLRSLKSLSTLSLLSLGNLNTLNLDPLSDLENLTTLELGECCNMNDTFALEVLPKLTKLKRFRIEKGNNSDLNVILNSVENLTVLEQLELINVDVKRGFDIVIEKCISLRRLLVVPNYITMSATTNQLILNGTSKLKDSLVELVWVITNELLRVTELFIDQCEESLQNKIKKQQFPFLNNGNDYLSCTSTSSTLNNIGNTNSTSTDNIPVLKPITLKHPVMAAINGCSSTENGDGVETDEYHEGEGDASMDSSYDSASGRQTTPAQVEILSLAVLNRMLVDAMPKTNIRIAKVPFSATWKQVLS